MAPPKKRVRKDASSSEEEGSAYESDEHSVADIVDSDALDDETPPPESQTSKKKVKSSATKSKVKPPPKKKEKASEKKVKAAPVSNSKGKPGWKEKGIKTEGQEKKTSPKKKETKKRKRDDSEEEEFEDDEDGVEVIGKIVQAPTTGRVPPGQISQNTLNFLNDLKKPANNDREWFKLHEPVYRQAEKEWTDFIISFTDVLAEVDDEIPHLPPRDVVHRIYRDVRFSNDKTPYKTNFSASFSRTGRKGIFAHYHLSIKPGGGSILAAGVWCPGKNELESIRAQIRRDSSQLREVISEPTFESLFGVAKWSKDKRQNIFGGEDQLKVAPKGVAKDHPDIDLLKCRSYAVVHKFTDEQVLDPEFKEILRFVVDTAKPFVHRLNHMMTIHADDDDDEVES